MCSLVDEFTEFCNVTFLGVTSRSKNGDISYRHHHSTSKSDIFQV